MVQILLKKHAYGVPNHPKGEQRDILVTDVGFLRLRVASNDPPTFTTAGFWYIKHAPPFAALGGIAQSGYVFAHRSTIIYPRALGVNSATGKLYNYSLIFEPHRWVDAGVLDVTTDDETPTYRFSNWGGGEMPVI